MKFIKVFLLATLVMVALGFGNLFATPITGDFNLGKSFYLYDFNINNGELSKFAASGNAANGEKYSFATKAGTWSADSYTNDGTTVSGSYTGTGSFKWKVGSDLYYFDDLSLSLKAKVDWKGASSNYKLIDGYLEVAGAYNKDPNITMLFYGDFTSGILTSPVDNKPDLTDRDGFSLSIAKKGDNNVQVPEPATMLLVGFGLIGIAGISKRKFKK